MEAKHIPEADSRHEAAADWLQRLDHAQLTEEEIQSWLEWFGASDENRAAFEEVQNLRRAFRELPAGYSSRELKRRLGVAEPSDADKRGTAPERGEGWKLTRIRSRPALHVEETARRRRRTHVRMAVAAASLCTFAVGLGAWWAMRTNEALYTAAANHHRMVKLEDGSSLVLGADAVVAVAYSRTLRSLDVQRGQAYFEVRQNSRRPFVVEAGGVRVTALGTAFNVQRESDRVTVTVTDGRVAVDEAAERPPSAPHSADVPPKKPDKQKPIYLKMGQRATLPLAVPAQAAALNATSRLEWQDGRADFIDTPLSQVLPLINRYAAMKIVIDDPRVADLTYSGTVFRSHLDEWVASLPRLYPIRTVALENNTITLVSRISQ